MKCKYCKYFDRLAKEVESTIEENKIKLTKTNT